LSASAGRAWAATCCGGVIAAFPDAKERVPELRMIVVAGPRIDPSSLPYTAGLEVVPYVHNLYRHLAACDLAVVQGGPTTSMELTAQKRPFIYFPLRHHFEQNSTSVTGSNATGPVAAWSSTTSRRSGSPRRSRRRSVATSTTATWRPTAPPGRRLAELL
jgi:Glycosyltransferase family 28 C-terminal domain